MYFLFAKQTVGRALENLGLIPGVGSDLLCGRNELNLCLKIPVTCKEWLNSDYHNQEYG